jgi:alpha-galactosidase
MLYFLLLALSIRAASAAGTPMPTPRTPPMGWSSWNAFYCSVDEPSVRQNAELLISTGLRDLGYDQLNIDDCWVRLCCIHPCHQPRAQRTAIA